ncbi:hypothetical protein Y024_5459 [Burkholderia pseudomallei TSV44]|nr:hypothetical protein Y024_5459 [Burkholderia pseudomallei TSV44]
MELIASVVCTIVGYWHFGSLGKITGAREASRHPLTNPANPGQSRSEPSCVSDEKKKPSRPL